MKHKLKLPHLPSKKILQNFFIDLNLRDLIKLSKLKNKKLLYKGALATKPYVPELIDLYLIYKIVELNKRTTVLEIGSGWSTLIINLALNKIKKKNLKKSKKLRRKNLFELFVLESEKKYLNITKKKLKKYGTNKIKTNYFFSESRMTTFNGRICHKFDKLPNCNPDFIYLDGPGKDVVKKKINNITVSKNVDMPPMSCDILKIEFFLIPGTIVLVDGRAANVNFLRKNFKRKWKYKYYKKFDQHIFLLEDDSFGKINDDILNFYK
tara:strand:- start:23861 stop:24658 length:798 start_codon:yes stop_codon:yes gene_type:complete